MYTSNWRGQLTSDTLCSEAHMQCTGNVYDTNAAPRSRQNALLTALPAALLLILVIFSI